MATHETNGEKNISWHWLAVTLCGIVLVLIGMIYNSLVGRVAAVEASNTSRDSSIAQMSGNIIRICNKLNIAQCQ